MKDKIDKNLLIRLNNIKHNTIYSFQNFIKTEISPNSLITNPSINRICSVNSYFTDRNKDIHIKMAKIKGVLFDMHLLNNAYNNNKEELLISAGTGRVEIFSYNKQKFTYTEIATLIDENEDYSCIDFYKDKDSDLSLIDTEEYILTFAGEKGIIRVVSFSINSFDCCLYEITEMKSLIGHRDAINDLKINPVYNDLLLSASKDNSIRLWNYLLSFQLAIFAGKEGHEVMVIALGWHFSGKTFCSGGGDRIKIWEVTNDIIAINESLSVDQINKVKTSLCPLPIYSIDVHCSYVDSVYYIGDIILSKSFNDNGGEIVEWAPFRFNNQTNKENNIANNLQSLDSQGFCYMIINRYTFPLEKIGDKVNKIFYFKMFYNEETDSIIVGNNQGKIFLFKRKADLLSASDYIRQDDGFYDLKPIEPSCEIFIIDGTIRKAILSSNIVYIANDYGSVVRATLK